MVPKEVFYLPAILVLILSVAHSAIREDSAMLEPAEKISAAEMIRAVSLYQEMTARDKTIGGISQDETHDNEEPSDQPDVGKQTNNPNFVHPLSMSQRERIEKSRR